MEKMVKTNKKKGCLQSGLLRFPAFCSWLWVVFSAPSALGPPCDVVAASWQCPASLPATAWLSPASKSNKFRRSKEFGVLDIYQQCRAISHGLFPSQFVWFCFDKPPQGSKTLHFLVDSFTDPTLPGPIPLAPVGCNLRSWIYECRGTIELIHNDNKSWAYNDSVGLENSILECGYK